MEIDESRKYILTNYEEIRKGEKACDSDYATEVLDIDLNIFE